MSSFKICSKTEEIGTLPEGCLLVDNVTPKMRIVTSGGDSMPARSRAIVPSADVHTQNLISRGTLRIVVSGNVKGLTEVVLLDADGASLGTASVVSNIEESSESEQTKKSRKKKTETQSLTEEEVEQTQELEEVVQDDVVPVVEMSDTDTSTDTEQHSV